MKTCSTCKETKSLDNFHRNNAAKDGLDHRCKPCILKRNRDRRDERRAYTNSLKVVGCTVCGELHEPDIMDLHHTDPKKKEYTVSHMVSSGLSMEKIKAEIEKCVVICKPCHREIHSGSR